MYDIKKYSNLYAQEQKLAKLRIKHVKRMDRIRADEGDWNAVFIATAYALIGFAIGLYTAILVC